MEFTKSIRRAYIIHGDPHRPPTIIKNVGHEVNRMLRRKGSVGLDEGGTGSRITSDRSKPIIYKSVVESIILDGAETWSIKEEE